MEGVSENTVEGPDRVVDPAGSEERAVRLRGLVAGLRSGSRAQTSGVLQRKSAAPFSPVGFCCLGVACEVAISQGLALAVEPQGSVVCYGSGGEGSSTTVLPDKVVGWFGFPDDNPFLRVPDEVADEVDHEEFQAERDAGNTYKAPAAELNDEYGLTLAQIADCFEYTFLPQDWEVTRASRRP